MLDFNWIFFGNQAKNFIALLSRCSNDEIFATEQIRVLIEFFWQGYFKAIINLLFLPFTVYMALFSFYVTYNSRERTNEFSLLFCLEMASIVIMGKCFMRFILLESIQLSINGWGYFKSFWNYIDVGSLILNAIYVFIR